jgi:hypothetical protein
MSILYVNTITPNSGDTVTVSGSLTTTGKFTIGDSTGDTVAITAEITSSLIPDLDNTFNLGSSTKEWKDLYVDGVAYLDQISASALPTSEASANSGELYTLSGSQLFSSSLVTTGHMNSFVTASLFVFLKS